MKEYFSFSKSFSVRCGWSPHWSPGTLNRVSGTKMQASAGMEGPLRANLHEWGPFQFKFPHRSLEIKNQMPDRSFPPPWSVEEHSGYFVVCDHRGQGLAYIYYENELRPAISRTLLTKDEARRIAANVWPSCRS